MIRFLILALLLLAASCAERQASDFRDNKDAFEIRMIPSY